MSVYECFLLGFWVMWNLWVFYDEIYKFLGFWIYGLGIEIGEFVVVVVVVHDDESMMKKVEEERDWWWMNLWCMMKMNKFLKNGWIYWKMIISYYLFN
jgi:hypothetical protein